MPFQALPLALRSSTGSPLSKLLIIHLVEVCQLVPVADLGGSYRESLMVDLRADDAAQFCQCSEDEIYGALDELERHRLAYPCPQWNFGQDHDRKERWAFLLVVLPMSTFAAKDRSKIKCSDDQIELLRERDRHRNRGHCPTCGTQDDEVPGWAVDHIIPRSVGGADVEENCQAICSRCNSRKGARVHWVDFLGGRHG